MGSLHGDTVILGAGIIGLSTAYYLCRSGNTKPESIHLVDSSEQLLHCASGFAGGFLAADCMLHSTNSQAQTRLQTVTKTLLTCSRVCTLQRLPRRALIRSPQVARRGT